MNQAISKLLALSFLACAPFFLRATDGYKIRVKLENYKNDTLLLGYHYGDKQYLKDTAIVGKDGYFTFEDPKTLECGVYLLVLKPDNRFVQVLIGDAGQDFTILANADDPVVTFKAKGSPDNEYFYEYLQWLDKARKEADGLRSKMTDLTTPADSAKTNKRLAEIDEEVKLFQQKLVEKHPNSMSAKIVKSAMEQKIPDMVGEEKDLQMRRYLWYKSHYFDNIDIADPCMLRSPVLHQRMLYYVDKLTVQHPDSINDAIDFLLKKCEKSEETYKFYLIHFLNFYAKSNLVGMDAVYVHIADKYYCQGKATWAKKEDLDKICDNASRIRPILLGKIAPNIECEDRTGKKFNLYDIDSEYTVLWFWAWDCGHCKKSSPFMIDFIKKWEPKGVKIFAVCTALSDKTGECWKEIDAREFNDHFINVVDPYLRSNYKTLYDVRSTPQLFILNRKHEIIMKKVASEQLEEVMKEVIEMEELKRKDGIKK